MPLSAAHPRNTDPELDRHCEECLKSKFWVVTCISNPSRYKTRYALYRQFRRHVLEDLKVGLVTVECALNDLDFHITASKRDNEEYSVFTGTHENGTPFIDVRVRNYSWIWLKENLWQIGTQHLPLNCQFVMYCDADIHFDNPHIVHECIVQLQTHKVVQPWYHCLDLGPRDQVLQVHQSFLSCACEGLEWKMSKSVDKNGVQYFTQKSKAGIANLWHPGYCIAWRRSAIDKLPLLDVGVLGAGDHHMAGALIGRYEQTLPGGIHPNYKSAVEKWQKRAAEVVKGDYGFVDGTIRHFWHGPKSRRKYIERWQILVSNKFDPLEDVYKNGFGVLELRPERAKLRDEIRRYLTQRNEDSVDDQ